jgi:oligopeptidase B
MPADKPSGRFKVIERRRHGVHYSVDHVGDRFFIRTNLAAPDFRVVTAPPRAPRAANWTQLIPHTPGRLISPRNIAAVETETSSQLNSPLAVRSIASKPDETTRNSDASFVQAFLRNPFASRKM